ncbi:MAG TPA: MFS transporter [Vicinamibacterales bacterium]|nr:MFS transporter [Vicinamibacterales bacterium]
MVRAAAAAGPRVDARRLFIGSCMALVATSTAFGVVGASMLAFKNEFILTNQQVGWIGGAALWGFTVSMVVFGPFVDSIGMKNLVRLAWVAHFAGTLTIIFANGFAMLFTGALVIALGNGLVEAACNPLVATLYPEDKTVKLNQFHVWFPGGITISGVVAYLLAQAGVTNWQITIGLILIPTVLYGLLFLGQELPVTERVQSGYSTAEMWRATLLNPFFLLLLLVMTVTASMELGPNRWVPAVLEAGGIPGILVLAYINGLMAILRYRAGDVVHRLRPTGILLAGSILAGIGLLWLSYAETGVVAFAAATIFAVGICYFWPTMLGLVAERNVRGGALALALMGGAGMAAVGLVTSPVMGQIADRYAHEQLPVDQTVKLLETVSTTFPALAEKAEGRQGSDWRAAADAAAGVLAHYREHGTLPEIETANALRAIVSSGADSPAVAEAQGILGPADNYGGRMSFRWVAPLSIFLVVVFSLLYLNDRRRGAHAPAH